ncbi:MAG: hypothetical protein ACRDID_20895 [Ktedonobacterales bacterium]
MRSNIVPPNRFLTIALLIGMLALIAYGISRRDPATIIIVIALAVFFGAPAFLLFNANRLQRRRPPSPDDATSDDSELSDHPDER